MVAAEFGKGYCILFSSNNLPGEVEEWHFTGGDHRQNAIYNIQTKRLLISSDQCKQSKRCKPSNNLDEHNKAHGFEQSLANWNKIIA